MRTLVGLAVLLPLTGFCVFGFLATFEPLERQAEAMAFRAGYAAVGLVSLGASLALVVRSLRT